MSVLAEVSSAALGDAQLAARALVRHGVLAPHQQRELALVRRFARDLDQAFGDLCGYQLVLRGRGARLVRRHDAWVSSADLSSHRGRAFDRERLALLFLCLAELDRFSHQVALSELASALYRSALDLGSAVFDPDRHAHRRAFCDVLDCLARWGVLRLADGATDAWERDPDAGEALFDVDHDAALLLFRPTRVLEQLDSVAELVGPEPTGAGRDARRQATRRRVARALIEQPVVFFDALDEAAARYLRLEWQGLARDCERLFGCAIERRQEGACLIDRGPGSLGERFPQGGSTGHVALILAERIVRGAEGAPVVPVPSRDPAVDLDRALGLPGGPARTSPTVQGPFLTHAWLEQTAEELLVEYADALKAEHRASAGALLSDGLELLARFGLVAEVPGGIVALSALARYRRPELVRPEGPQVGLFGEGA